MKRAVILIIAIGLSASAAVPQQQNSVLVDRVGDTGFVQLSAPSFDSLDARRKQLAYWLVQASIAIDPIIYDQLSGFGLRQKRLLEGIVAHPQGIDPKIMGEILAFAKLFWANRGNHNKMTSQKFLPQFAFEELRTAAVSAHRNGGMKNAYADLPPIPDPQALDRELTQLRPAFFDPSFEPMITTKSPAGGKDIIQASSNTFYRGVRLADLNSFQSRYPLNSRIVKGPDGKLIEEVYRAGTPDGKAPPGLYAVYLKKAIGYLEKARSFADPQQAAVISALIRFYQTGEPRDWLAFGSAWVQNNSDVDFANGFIEVYRDAHAMKGSSQSFVSITDRPVTNTVVKLAQNAAYFEQKAPWDPKYKKQNFKPPVVKAVETLIETGDFAVTTIGVNLPNENEIHEKYGTKNFLLTASSRILSAATGSKPIEEFGGNQDIVARAKRFGDQANELMTAMHEVIGHGSGKLSEKLKGGSEPYLKEYFSTMEEARADLMALWSAWDPKLKELGLVSNQEETAKAMYDSAALVVLTQLRRIPKGDTIEEDHQRARALIANYLIDKVEAIAVYNLNGKTYLQVKDYQQMHEGIGSLLSELMRIKAEGDYSALKQLVEGYGVHFKASLRDQVVARYQKLNLPTYWAGINPELTAKAAANGNITSIEITYPRNAARQYLGYGAMYDPGLQPGK